MKKIYALGMAMMVCGSAIAAPNTIRKVNDQLLPLGKMKDPSELTVNTPMKAAPAKAVSSVDDLVGMYKWTYLGILEGNSGDQMSAVWIEKVAGSTTQVQIKGFPMPEATLPVIMNVDFATKKVTIQDGQKCVDMASLGLTRDDWYLYVYLLTKLEDGTTKPVRVTAATADKAAGTINEDGSIEFPGYVTFGCTESGHANDGGWYFLAQSNKMVLTKMNTINEADYESIGMGKFTDCWINDRFQTPVVEEEEVEVLQNKTNPKLLIIKDPYASDIWKQNGGNASKTGKGYIQFNIADPDWVEVTVLTNSGYAEDMSEAEDGSVTDDFYMTNTEGYLSFLGGDIENTKLEWAMVGDVPSNLTGNTITILHQLFTDANAPLTPNWWGHYDSNNVWIEAERSEGKLVLPAGWSGVSDIVSDFDAPVKYYNLQGIELAAPVKGQLTIKKQGNKTVKFIAK